MPTQKPPFLPHAIFPWTQTPNCAIQLFLTGPSSLLVHQWGVIIRVLSPLEPCERMLFLQPKASLPKLCLVKPLKLLIPLCLKWSPLKLQAPTQRCHCFLVILVFQLEPNTVGLMLVKGHSNLEFCVPLQIDEQEAIDLLCIKMHCWSHAVDLGNWDE